MRTVAMLLVGCLVAVVPVRAQDQGGVQEKGGILGITDWVGGAAVRAELQPATQPGRGGRTMFWVGMIMAAGGGAMAALSGNSLASESTYRYGCYEEVFGGPEICQTTENTMSTNQGFLWGGIAAAGTGIAMAIIGKGRQRPSIEVGLTRGGAVVSRRVTF